MDGYAPAGMGGEAIGGSAIPGANEPACISAGSAVCPLASGSGGRACIISPAGGIGGSGGKGGEEFNSSPEVRSSSRYGRGVVMAPNGMAPNGLGVVGIPNGMPSGAGAGPGAGPYMPPNMNGGGVVTGAKGPSGAFGASPGYRAGNGWSK